MQSPVWLENLWEEDQMKTTSGETNALRLHLPRRALLIVCLVLVPFGGWAAGQPATLRVVVTGCFGEGQLPNAEVQIISDDSTSVRYLKHPDRDSVTVLPGSYTLVASAAGFRTTAQRAVVNLRDVLVPICLNVSPIGIHGDQRAPSLVGKITKDFMTQGLMWARLVGVYNGLNTTEPIVAGSLVTGSLAEAGTFSFVGLRPGRYLLMLFDKNGMKISGQVNVRAFDTKVSVDAKGVAQEN